MSASTSGTRSSRSGWGLSRSLLVAGLIAALIYIVGMWINAPTVELITKGLPVLCLIIWVFNLPRDGFANLIVLGLILSLVADLVMQWDRALFLPGLLLFLVVQICYSTAFASLARRGSWLRLLFFALWGLVAFLILRPNLDDMTLPVGVYVVVIVIMMWRAAALVSARGKSQTFESAALLGALAFGLSDTLLAFNRFIWHDTLTMFNIQPAAPFVNTLVIILYWLGQWGIALAAGREAQDRTRGVAPK